jgi:hypothetical protein
VTSGQGDHGAIARLVRRLGLRVSLKQVVRFGRQVHRLGLVVGPGLTARVVKGRIGFAQVDGDEAAAQPIDQLT